MGGCSWNTLRFLADNYYSEIKIIEGYGEAEPLSACLLSDNKSSREDY